MLTTIHYIHHSQILAYLCEHIHNEILAHELISLSIHGNPVVAYECGIQFELIYNSSIGAFKVKLTVLSEYLTQ